MNKVFEALDRMSFHRFDEQYKEWDKDYEIVEKALQRLEFIDNAKPSEALETLKELKDNIKEEISSYYKGYVCCKEETHKYDDDFYTIEQALIKGQEQENVLNKIKEHIKYDERQMKFTLEIEVDDFNSSKEWNEFKRRLDDGQVGN